MKVNKLSIWIVEILTKWKAIKINQTEIDEIAKVYKERVNYIISTRDNLRSPDKEDEERKYRYFEGASDQTQYLIKNDNKISEIQPKCLFPSEEQTCLEAPISHDWKFYKSKLVEISKLITDK